MSLLTGTEKATEDKDCKGMVFRCSSSQFTYLEKSGKIVWGEKTFMKLLKRDSCPGCDQCAYMFDELHEFSLERDISFRPSLEPGAKYKLTVVDVGVDNETGYCDEWHLAFVKIEE